MFHHITLCLSQVYGCSDRYNVSRFGFAVREGKAVQGKEKGKEGRDEEWERMEPGKTYRFDEFHEQCSG